MGSAIPFVVIAFAGLAVVSCQVQLPCNSILRQFSVYAQYFNTVIAATETGHF